jgi:hypothetical protein
LERQTIAAKHDPDQAGAHRAFAEATTAPVDMDLERDDIAGVIMFVGGNFGPVVLAPKFAAKNAHRVASPVLFQCCQLRVVAASTPWYGHEQLDAA